MGASESRIQGWHLTVAEMVEEMAENLLSGPKEVSRDLENMSTT